MSYYGVRGVALKWFESYLSNRKQFPSVNGVSTDLLNVTCRVPLGSVLGPLLFLIFINDLQAVSKQLKFYLFADDTNIYFDAEKLEKIEKVVNSELRKVNRWLILNKLVLNIEKSNFVLFYTISKHPSGSLKTKIGDKRLMKKTMLSFSEYWLTLLSAGSLISKN